MKDNNEPTLALGCATFLIRTACRALPEAERADREMEWTSEAEAIALDEEKLSRLLRAITTLRFALSLALHSRATRRTRPSSRPTFRNAVSTAGRTIETTVMTALVALVAIGESLALCNGILLGGAGFASLLVFGAEMNGLQLLALGLFFSGLTAAGALEAVGEVRMIFADWRHQARARSGTGAL